MPSQTEGPMDLVDGVPAGLGRPRGIRLGETTMGYVDRQLKQKDSAIQLLTAKVEEYMEHARRIRNQLSVREDELRALAGPCGNSRCGLHKDHMLGCQPN